MPTRGGSGAYIGSIQPAAANGSATSIPMPARRRLATMVATMLRITPMTSPTPRTSTSARAMPSPTLWPAVEIARSAARSAGAWAPHLPTMATTRPWACRCRTTARASVASHLRVVHDDPGLGGQICGVGLGPVGHQDRFQAHRPQPVDTCACVATNGVADRDPSQRPLVDLHADPGAEPRTGLDPDPAGRTDPHRVLVDRSADADVRPGHHVGHPAARCELGDRPGDRMIGAVRERPREPAQVAQMLGVDGVDGHHAELAGRHRPVLVQDDGVDPAGRLHRRDTRREHPERARPPAPHQQRDRLGQQQSRRARRRAGRRGPPRCPRAPRRRTTTPPARMRRQRPPGAATRPVPDRPPPPARSARRRGARGPGGSTRSRPAPDAATTDRWPPRGSTSRTPPGRPATPAPRRTAAPVRCHERQRGGPAGRTSPRRAPAARAGPTPRLGDRAPARRSRRRRRCRAARPREVAPGCGRLLSAAHAGRAPESADIMMIGPRP